jgi:hypothetical protein
MFSQRNNPYCDLLLDCVDKIKQLKANNNLHRLDRRVDITKGKCKITPK